VPEFKILNDILDYDALIDVVTNEGKEFAEKYGKEEIKKMLKKAFK